MKIKKLDRIMGLFFAISTVVLIYMFFTNREFFTWAFSRHQNILSWYIRPLFIIPIVIGAYKQIFFDFVYVDFWLIHEYVLVSKTGSGG